MARQSGPTYVEGTEDPTMREERRRAEQRSVPELLGDLFDETRMLLREEVLLARVEIRERLQAIATHAVAVVLGAVLGLVAVLALAVAVNRGLTVLLAFVVSAEVAVWLSPLILAAVVGLVAWAFVAKGLRGLRSESLVPENTVASVRESAEWLRDKTHH